jgi:alpha-glucosidase
VTKTTGPSEWWRSASIYQIYPRSFADSDGDGLGDLPGITHRLAQLESLSLDAIWLSPFYASPQKDAGYDVSDYCAVDPRFGTLDDFDALLAEAHRLGMRVLIDLVPNHTSDQHAWFQAALAAGPGSEERSRYLFRDGTGVSGEIPPNNWTSVFGGPAWERVIAPDGTPEQWYLHLFDVSQPDLDWTSEWVRAQFRDILRFWLRRGVDGFRVDVAHGLVKKAGLPDFTAPAHPNDIPTADYPYWAQPGVHEIYRDWHDVLLEFGPDRILCAEAWVEPLDNLANWVRPDEMQQAFNFTFLEAPWSASAIGSAIRDSIEAFDRVGSVATWVLSNHDVIRAASRLGLESPPPQGDGIGPASEPKPDEQLGSLCPAAPTFTRATSSACPKTSSCRIPPGRTRASSAITAESTAGMDAACRFPGRRMLPPSAFRRRAAAGCRSRPTGHGSPGTSSRCRARPTSSRPRRTRSRCSAAPWSCGVSTSWALAESSGWTASATT